ncbi:hypothetical protein SKAU_G00309750 [Synaphobranchus kaupii]|uniref:Uncharacterized protein n=1 Tax=Synaphobranchus kaupii TaxID=118154 RepID=A0A9Q1IK67_SYNKA|nr:hypothetical protein SKAU_G00309750 [Synaphobranchus kaupii]
MQLTVTEMGERARKCQARCSERSYSKSSQWSPALNCASENAQPADPVLTAAIAGEMGAPNLPLSPWCLANETTQDKL